MGHSRAGRQGIDSIQDAGNTNEGDVIRLALGLKDPNRPIKLALSKIRRDGGTQPRAALNLDIVEEYAEAMRDEKKLPPAVVFYDGTDYWLVDGFHRVAAVELNEGEEYYFIVRQGTHRDAVLYSFGVNDEHGLRRTNEDKRRVVAMMLQDEEWRQFSDHQIAEACKVSHPFVGKIRASLETVSSDEPEKRTYITKHGTEATMNTERIRKANQQRAAGSDPTSDPAVIRPARLSLAELPEAIAHQVITALRQGDHTFAELLKLIKRSLGQEIDQALFNSMMRDMMKANMIAPGENDHTTFTLGPQADTAHQQFLRSSSSERPLARQKNMPKATGEGDEADLEVETLRKGLEQIVSLNDALFQSAVERMDVIDIRRLFDEVQAAYFKLENIGRWLEIEVRE